jgi:hypothetical protein
VDAGMEAYDPAEVPAATGDPVPYDPREDELARVPG